MAKLGIYEIVDYVCSQPKKEGKIEALRQHGRNPAFLTLLKMSLDPGLDWIISEDIGYRPAPDVEQEALMYSEVPKLTRFLNIPQLNHHARNVTPQKVMKFNKLFAGVLETLHPRDAEILKNVRMKKPMGPGLTKKLIDEALPGLLT